MCGARHFMGLVVLMSLGAGCALNSPELRGRQTLSDPLFSASPEDACRAFANALRRARCVASCRATGVACQGSPAIMERLLDDLEVEAGRLGRAARLSRDMGELHQALNRVSQSRALFSVAGKQWQGARLIPLEALVLLELGRPRSSAEVARLGLPILRGTGDARQALLLHLVHGLANLQLGDERRARSEFARAEGLRVEMADGPDLSQVDLLYARLALRLGHTDRATAAVERVDGAGVLGAEPRLQADVHQGRGEVYRMRGQLAAALGEHGLALSIEHEMGNRPGVVRQLLMLSLIFLDLGHLDVAYQLARNGAELASELGLGMALARSDVLLGRIGEALGTPRAAARSYTRALSRGPQTLFVGSANRLWAEAGAWRLCRSDRCPEVGMPLLPAKLSGRRAEVLPPLTSETLLASALVARELVSRGEREMSHAVLEGVEGLLGMALPPANAWRIHHQIGLTWRELGVSLRARSHLERALALLEVLRNGLDVHLLRRDLSHHRRAVYEDLVDTYVGRSLPPPPPADVEAAFDTSELMKARGALELFKGGGERSRAAKLVRHARVSRALMKRLETGPPADGAWSAVPAISKLCEVWSGMRWGPQDATDLPEPESLAGAHERVMSLLEQDTALLSYQLGPGRSYLWVLSRQGVTLHHLPGRQQIVDAVERYRRTLLTVRFTTEADRLEHYAAGRHLAALIFEPAAGEVGGVRRLIIAADGALQGIPFSTLIVGEGLKSGLPQYLVRSTALTQVPSASVWAALAARSKQRWAGARDGFLAVGDPVHGAGSGEEADLNVRVEFHDGSVTFVTDASRPQRRFGPLEHSRAELTSIARIMGKRRSNLLLGPDATETRLRDAALEKMRYIHFATHGLTDVAPLLPAELASQAGSDHLSSLVATEPALVLSRQENDGQDGLLRLEEILDLELSADLVVLSACSTGRGGRHLGESAHGLAGAFLYAGGRRAVASLWSVADKQTSALMVELYRGIERGLRPDEALRRAQLKMLLSGAGGSGSLRGVSEVTDEGPAARPRSAHGSMTPYFWAPFVVVGD